MNTSAVVSIVLALLGGVAPGTVAAQGKPIQPTFFGMHFHNATGWDSRRQRTVIPAIPVGSWRIWDARARWADLQPGRGTWRFETLDEIVNLAAQRGIDPLMVLGSTPAWASARPGEFCVYGSSGCASEPADLADWETYVHTLATRYKGRIRHWELWNEPKFSDFPQNFASSFFTGSTATMVKLAEIAHRVLKQVDPANRLLTPGFTGAVAQIEHYLRAGGGAFADGVAVHFYVARPLAIQDRLLAVRAVLQRNGLAHLPIWNTEQNFELLRADISPPGPHGFGVRGPEVQAAYVLQALVLQASLGVERVHWHSWENVFAVDGGAPNALGKSYATIGNWLIGSTVGPCETQRDRVISCPLQRGSTRAWVAWRTDGGKGNFRPPAAWKLGGVETPQGESFDHSGDAEVDLGAMPVLLRSNSIAAWSKVPLR